MNDEQYGGETECEHGMDVRCGDEQTDMKWNTDGQTKQSYRTKPTTNWSKRSG